MSDNMDELQKVNIDALNSFEVERYGESHERAIVQPLDFNADISESDVQRITELCNQTAIYNLLFAERLQGRPYTEDDARFFINKSIDNWKEGKSFVFIVKDSANKIIGAIDIKSADVSDAEIGYWMDAGKPGYMTNVVKGLVKIAKNANYKRLVGYTRPENERSSSVVLRAGFRFIGQGDRKGKGQYNVFEINL